MFGMIITLYYPQKKDQSLQKFQLKKKQIHMFNSAGEGSIIRPNSLFWERKEG